MFEVASPFTIRVKPYRSGWLWHLAHLRFRTAFCALFGLTRWRIPGRRPSRLLDNPGLSFTPTAEQLEIARAALKADTELEQDFINGAGTGEPLGIVGGDHDWMHKKVMK